MQPTKPPFDPRVHLLSPDASEASQAAGSETAGARRSSETTSEDGDEAIARFLQRQMLEEDRRSLNSTHSQEAEDLELARRVQYGEENTMTSAATMRNLEDRKRQAGFQDDLEYARRMQQQEAMWNIKGAGQQDEALHDQMEFARQQQERAFQDLQSQNDTSGATAETLPAASDFGVDGLEYARMQQEHALQQILGGNQRHESEDASGHEHTDLELALHLQELESRGEARGGPMTGRPGLDDSSDSLDLRRTLSETNLLKNFSSQEEEDAFLARMMAESGESLRSLDLADIPSRAQLPETKSLSPLPHPKDISRRPPILPGPGSRGFSDTFDPPGLNLPEIPESTNPKPKSKKRTGFFGFGKRAHPPSIPAPIPPPPARKRPGPLPYSETATRNPSGIINTGPEKRKNIAFPARTVCSICKKPAGTFLVALGKKYHLDCFRCMGCNEIIDSNAAFAYMTDDSGEKHPLHGDCYAELYGVKCAVCRNSIPAGEDGKVSYVKHPFFDNEIMCPYHASSPGRRCTGCHRFEPVDEPFAELNDSGRCVCYSCCRTVVVDSKDAESLWQKVIDFFEQKLELPIWQDMRQVPVLIVGYEALNDQMVETGGAHGGSSQIMTRGLCLTEHQSGKRVKLSKLKFDLRTSSFRKIDVEQSGFTFFQVPDPNKVNPNASVTCILCLSGLPSDLTASVLAHEATHAWIKLHPQYDFRRPIPPQVEEGVAQLVAMLFLSDGLDPASSESSYGDSGPTEAKLRQYFKFSIETDDHEIYGLGYRKAAKAYADIGLQALLSHIVLYQEFPQT